MEEGRRRDLRPSRQPREERAAAAAESKQRVWPAEQRRAGGREPRLAQSFPLGFPGFVAQSGSRKRETLRVMGGGRGEKQGSDPHPPSQGEVG